MKKISKTPVLMESMTSHEVYCAYRKANELAKVFSSDDASNRFEISEEEAQKLRTIAENARNHLENGINCTTLYCHKHHS